MSVFKSLKGTLQNVQQDIVDSFRALTSIDSTPRHEKLKQLRADGISMDGGADLLYRYQKEWAELHNCTTETAKKAEEADRLVGKLFTKHQQQWESACHLEEETAALPAFLSTVQDMILLIGSLQQDFEAVEKEVDKLLNVCEEQALEQEKESHMLQLAAYKKTKSAEAFSVKVKLWNMLKDKAKECETRKSHAMKERQEAFLDAFTSDMDYYRKHGHPDKMPTMTEFPKVSSLSEITIEEDKKALNDFLSSDEHHEGEEEFIEDDYTTDYGAAEERHGSFSELDGDSTINFDDTDKVTSESQNAVGSCSEHTGETEHSTQPGLGSFETPDTERLPLSKEKIKGDVSETKDVDRDTTEKDGVSKSNDGDESQCAASGDTL